MNAISLCTPFQDEYTPSTLSMLVDRHQDYRAKGDESRHKASQVFFERLGLISLLGEREVHSMVTIAARNLLRVHDGWDNFYNEPPFAERLAEIVRGIAIPESAQSNFVEAVVTCGVGNLYGVSRGALMHYQAMVKSFSPRAIDIMLRLPAATCVVATRLKMSADCKKRFAGLVQLIDEGSVPTVVRTEFDRWRPSDG